MFSYANASRTMSSWMELWTVAMTRGRPAADRTSAQRTKPCQSVQGASGPTTSPDPPVLMDWMTDEGLPRPICSSAGTDPTKAPSSAFCPIVVMMPPPDCPGTSLIWAAGVPFTMSVHATGRDSAGLSGTRQNPYRLQKYGASLTIT
ncbi:MAG: hypothetical protein CVV32_00105 [Methanomicrobiales archaeon HGW-Methanomicrobiales-3]|nr:MAG: hypothetical protein CVV32_00105 [Methanomicrobiales archaeon HGW-Methanomicrobiales-3]